MDFYIGDSGFLELTKTFFHREKFRVDVSVRYGALAIGVWITVWELVKNVKSYHDNDVKDRWMGNGTTGFVEIAPLPEIQDLHGLIKASKELTNKKLLDIYHQYGDKHIRRHYGDDGEILEYLRKREDKARRKW